MVNRLHRQKEGKLRLAGFLNEKGKTGWNFLGQVIRAVFKRFLSPRLDKVFKNYVV